MNFHRVAEFLSPLLPAELKELKAHVDEFFPFRPPAPVDELVAQAALFLSQELGDELVHIQHFGSTAKKNGKPHRGSDVDLMVVVANTRNCWQVERQLEIALSESQLPQGLFQFVPCSELAWDYPWEVPSSEEVILQAQYEGKPVPIPRHSPKD